MSMKTRDRTLAALRIYPDSHSVDIAEVLGITTKKLSGTITTLLADGLISRAGIYGKRTYRLTDYGMRYAPATLPESGSCKSRLVVRTEANGICQECRNSPAMQRVLAVYGRGYARLE